MWTIVLKTYLDDAMQQYEYNYSCSGCTDDIHATNQDDDALFDDGSCFFNCMLVMLIEMDL